METDTFHNFYIYFIKTKKVSLLHKTLWQKVSLLQRTLQKDVFVTKNLTIKGIFVTIWPQYKYQFPFYGVQKNRLLMFVV